MADRVFEDRLGLWIVDPARGRARIPQIRTALGGLVRDTFWPRTSEASDLQAARDGGLYAHLWVAVDGRQASELVAETLADLARLKPGALELNIELGVDAPLPAYIVEVVHGIRDKRRNLRMRLNLAPWKGFAIPRAELESDPNLYVCEQNYAGNMEELLSSADAYLDLTAWGAPASKVTVCYAAQCRVLGSPRLRTLPDLSRLKRGLIYQDDLLHDAGLL